MAGKQITMKKSSPFVLIIPLIIAIIVAVSVVVVRYFSPVPQENKAAPNPTPENIPPLIVPTSKPVVGFDQMQSTTPVSDLRDSLNQAADSGTSELDSLSQEAASL